MTRTAAAFSGPGSDGLGDSGRALGVAAVRAAAPSVAGAFSAAELLLAFSVGTAGTGPVGFGEMERILGCDGEAANSVGGAGGALLSPIGIGLSPRVEPELVARKKPVRAGIGGNTCTPPRHD